MITQVSISGLGPHLDFTAELDPRGTNILSGPSESGKSFLVEAIVFCLWGKSVQGKFQPEAIHDGADKAEVEIHLDSGRILRRSITRGRSQQRQITLAGDTQSYSSDKKFAEALGELAEDEEAVRVVVVPMAWKPLVATNARKFRDLLMRLLPEGDVVGEVQRLVTEAGFSCTEEEAELEDKVVNKKRSAARKSRDEAAGRVQSVEERIAALEASLGEMADSSGAEVDEALLARVDAWSAYERALGAGEERKAAEGAQRAWDERRAELGDEPEAGPDMAAVIGDFKTKKKVLHEARVSAKELYGRQQVVAAKLADYGDDHDPSTCPTCHRPGWEEGTKAHQELVEQNKRLLAELDVAKTEGLKLRGAFEEADAAVEAAREKKGKHDQWKASLNALGPRPELPDLPDDAPEPPASERPTPEEFAAAREGAAAAGARKQRQDDLEAAAAKLEEDQQLFEQRNQEAERLNALIEAVRVAPSTVAAEMALALGDLGPVSLRFGENPAIEVLIDGRPWWLASRGRQVVADGYLRGAIRQVMEMDHLPICLDNVQDVGGQPLPHLEPPLILLRTDEGPDLKVKRK